MSENCQLIVFSNKAYNAIIRESFDKDPVETGGILLGHVLDNGIWIVMEVLPPGINSIFQYAYFEYDDAFVNYLAQSVANQYKHPLDLLGLWHRHPGSMDVFSTTDDETNATFAHQNPAGVISGLVNIDPKFRMTMYHMDMQSYQLMGTPDYDIVDVEVGDDIIPKKYFELRYYDGNVSDLHPMISSWGRERQKNHFLRKQSKGADDVSRIQSSGTNSYDLPPNDELHNSTLKPINDILYLGRTSNKKWLYVLIAITAIIIGAFIIKSYKLNVKGIPTWINWSKKERSEKVSQLFVDSIVLTLGQAKSIDNYEEQRVRWKSDDSTIAKIDENGTVFAVALGETEIEAIVDGKEMGSYIVTVIHDVSKDEAFQNSGINENYNEERWE